MFWSGSMFLYIVECFEGGGGGGTGCGRVEARGGRRRFEIFTIRNAKFLGEA